MHQHLNHMIGLWKDNHYYHLIIFGFRRAKHDLVLSNWKYGFQILPLETAEAQLTMTSSKPAPEEKECGNDRISCF